MQGDTLREVRAKLYKLFFYPINADPMHRVSTPLAIRPDGPWFQEDYGGVTYNMTPACVRGLMVSLLVEANIRFTHLVP